MKRSVSTSANFELSYPAMPVLRSGIGEMVADCWRQSSPTSVPAPNESAMQLSVDIRAPFRR